jgi:hypothetical protein|tara:strand:+ start:1234 stop:2115 length:882 start_codon:yes stop_codon:yes gene_type:complete
MKITNKHNLPELVVNALTFDTYSRGESDISITQLIDSPRISLLERQHSDEIEQDAVDFLWSRFGTSVHEMFERSTQGEDCISEERLFVERDGWTVSGAIDLQQVEGGVVTISDYKVTSAWSVIFDKKEWHKQLNCYGWLVRHAKKMPVKELRIIALLRDWNRRKSEEGGDYPRSPIEIVKIPMWTDGEQDKYVQDRIRSHQNADFDFSSGDDLPLCSADERWQKDTTYAVMKKKRVRAIKLHKVEDDAIDHADNLGTDHFVETRVGESTRCVQNWCRVNQWCDQYKEDANAWN